ncbi:7-hydroxymethyl chlorophyll a reductase, chloroplastic [Dirofilaria immitis]
MINIFETLIYEEHLKVYEEHLKVYEGHLKAKPFMLHLLIDSALSLSCLIIDEIILPKCFSSKCQQESKYI